MQAPEVFIEKLEREFRGRLRIRWSVERGEFHIEQKVARGLFPGTRPTKRGWDESVDKYVQHRDGYVFIMAVRTGDRMPCPRCSHELKVPFMDTKHVKCSYCTLLGRPTYTAAVFMPLGDKLINHLKSIDPENPISEKLAENLDRENQFLEARMINDAVRPAEGAFEDNYRRVVEIPTAHLSGKTKFWLPKGKTA